MLDYDYLSITIQLHNFIKYSTITHLMIKFPTIIGNILKKRQNILHAVKNRDIL